MGWIHIEIAFMVKVVVVVMVLFVLRLLRARSLIDLETILDTPDPPDEKRSGNGLEEAPDNATTHGSSTTRIDHCPYSLSLIHI